MVSYCTQPSNNEIMNNKEPELVLSFLFENINIVVKMVTLYWTYLNFYRFKYDVDSNPINPSHFYGGYDWAKITG